MNIQRFALVALASLAVLAGAGCAPPKVDTASVRAGLQGLGPGPKAQLEVALTAIDAGHYKDAVMPLRRVAFGSKLDGNQRKIIEDTMTKIRAHIAKGE